MKNPPVQNRYSSLQALRGLAAVAVVFHNTNFAQFELTGANNRLLPGASIGELGVDLFFVLSGFLMVSTTWSQSGGLKTAGRFLASRALRIYPLYWVMALIWAATLVLAPQASLGRQSADLASSLLLTPSASTPQLTQAWSLVFEVFFYLVFGLMMLTRQRKAALAGWALWLGGCALTGFRLPTAAGHLVSNPLALEFLIGCGVAYLSQRRISRPLLLLVCGLVLAPVGEFVRSRLSVDANMAESLRALMVGAPAGAVVLGAVAMERAGRLRIPGWLEGLGDRSFALYLVNSPVACLLAATFMTGLGASPVRDAAFATAAFALSVVAMEVLHLYAERPLLAMARRLLNGAAVARPSATGSRVLRPAA